MGRTVDRITPSLERMKRNMETKVPHAAYRFWKDLTPKRTGNAKRRTKLRKTKIVADYDYATFLDKGSSRKAPKGMSGPTSVYVARLVKKYLRK